MAGRTPISLFNTLEPAKFISPYLVTEVALLLRQPGERTHQKQHSVLSFTSAPCATAYGVA